MTKIEMARRVVACLHQMTELPPADDPRVIVKAEQTDAVLLDQLNMARAAYESGSCVVNPDA